MYGETASKCRAWITESYVAIDGRIKQNAFELPIFAVNHGVFSTLIATPTDLKKRLPNFEGGSLGFRQSAVILSIFATL